MKERPILFSAPMVRALLDGTKTQTRRPVKPAPILDPIGCFEWPVSGRDALASWAAFIKQPESMPRFCPYGVPGDRLWVRETVGYLSGAGRRVVYRADADPPMQRFYPGETVAGMKWKPSIHMLRSESRITLEVTDVRVERLQSISEEDALAEGCTPLEMWGNNHVVCDDGFCFDVGDNYIHGVPKVGDLVQKGGTAKVVFVQHTPPHQLSSARDAFRLLWIRINGLESWDANPWVWAISFKVITPAQATANDAATTKD